MERIVAVDSGATIKCIADGVVEKADANRIVVKRGSDTDIGFDVYNLMKFQKSNHNTCLDNKPIVSVGDVVKAGDIIADGPSTDLGELALGQNVLVAFMVWNGYNFEDSIVLSEDLVKKERWFHIDTR